MALDHAKHVGVMRYASHSQELRTLESLRDALVDLFQTLCRVKRACLTILASQYLRERALADLVQYLVLYRTSELIHFIYGK